MQLRAVVTFFVAVVSLPRVLPATEVLAGRWQAAVAPPRAGLPAVELDLGYAGAYVPAVNAPADFRARSAGQPFDGYIGYHIAIGDRLAPDTAVVARAVLPPHSQWTFSTPIRLFVVASWREGYFEKHELVVEWRDRNRNLIAQRSAGVPPWIDPPRPLRVVRFDGEPVSADCFGETAVLLPASSLSGSPQWYGGFSSVVVPIGLWFELPRRTREAIFRSALDVVFVGVPERMPKLDPIDRALLPVAFRPEPGPVEVPWPYRGRSAATIPAAVSWRAKSGASAVGAEASPYLVMNGAATFVAGEDALREPLPSFRLRFVPLESIEFSRRRPTFAEILSAHRPALLFTLLCVLSIAAWLLIRRRPHAAIFAATGAIALLTIGWRNGIRPAADHHTYERLTTPAAGIVDVVTEYRDYGPAPRRVPSGELAAAAASRVFGWVRGREGNDVEIRTSETPTGFGELHTPGRPWVSTSRMTRRRELGVPAIIDIRSRDADRLVVEYASTIPVDYIAAEWTWNGRRRYGETHATSQRGVATIVNARLVWPSIGFWSWVNEIWRTDSMLDRGAAVGLLHIERDRTVHIRQLETTDPSPARTYVVFARLQRDGEGDLSTMFFLPARIPDGAVVSLSVFAGTQFIAGRDITAFILSGAAGMTRVEPDRSNANATKVSVAEIQRIAPGTGLVRVSVETSPSASAVESAALKLRVWEKRP